MSPGIGEGRQGAIDSVSTRKIARSNKCSAVGKSQTRDREKEERGAKAWEQVRIKLSGATGNNADQRGVALVRQRLQPEALSRTQATISGGGVALGMPETARFHDNL